MRYENKIDWCYCKSQYKVVESNDNLAKAYLIKAENSLKAMRNEKDNVEWEVTAAYYTLYFSIYAIMMKIGVKCENHSCTIEFIKTYLKDNFTDDDIKLLQDARDFRNQVQYYVVTQEELKNYKIVISKVLDLYLKSKSILLKLNNQRIIEIRKQVNSRF